MRQKKKKKSNNATYCERYRQKVQLKRLQCKRFDIVYRENVARRQALCRERKKQRQQPIKSTSVVTISRADLRKREGIQRRRQNTTQLKLEIDKLKDSNKQLQRENAKLKEQLNSFTSSSSQQSNSDSTTTTAPSSSSSNQSNSNNTTTTSPSTLFFQHLSPNAKRRATARMMAHKIDLPRGTTRSIRNNFGINLSNQNLPPTGTTKVSRDLAIAIEQFLNNEEITRVTPDKKRIIDGKQVRFLLNHLINLHQKFILTTNLDCSYSTFTRHVPSYIVSPKPSDWGSCLCMTCLNPQIKVERINQIKANHPILNNLSTLLTNDIASTANDKKKVEEILNEVNFLKEESFPITYVEWIQKRSERSSGLISTKATMTDKLAVFCKKLSDEILKLHKHLDLVHTQFNGAKLYRQSALTIDNVVTLQIDWSENYNLKQTREERSAYYYEQHVSIAAGYVWQKNNCFSFGCLSDDTSHRSESTWVAIRDLLDELLSEKDGKRVTELNIISDSPSSQYRNKTTIFFLKYYATNRKITMRWIFLASGHGKGIADGIGATIKRLFDNVIRLNPDQSFNGAEDLMNKIKSSTTIRLYLYKKEDVDSLRLQIPSLSTITGTSKFHEIIAKPNGQMFKKDNSDEPETLTQTKF